MADINLFIFIAIGIVLGGAFCVSCIYVTCKLCSEYLYADPCKASGEACTQKLHNIEKEAVENAYGEAV